MLSQECASVLTDEERMKEDFWDLRTFSHWGKNEKQDKKLVGNTSPILDFREINNPNIRQELKLFYRHQILSGKRKLKTVCTQMFRERKMWDYINTLTLKESLLEISEQEIVSQYRQYLMNNTDWNLVSVIETLDGRQEPKYYVEDADCVNCMKQLYQYLLRHQQDEIPERDKDIWDVRRLPFYVEQQKSRIRHIINFTRIQQPAMRETVKTYIYERLKVRKLNCVFEDMKALNYFSGFLAKYYPCITEFSQLSRPIVDDYMVYLNKQDMVMTTKRSRAGYLRTFFKLSRFLELCELPNELLIPYGNLYKQIRKNYQVIPDTALQTLNEHLGELPREIRMATLLLEYVGMRINECCQLHLNCLKYDSEGGAFLEYYQRKTSHINRVPISKFLTEEIQVQQEAVKAEYPNSPYLLTVDGTNPIGQEAFSFHVNRLAYKYRIIDDNGNLFRFKSHQFRHTLATKYAMEGMSPNMIRELLGHQDMRSIKNYIDIRDTVINSQLQVFLRREDEQFKELRKEISRKQENSIPLTNGYCRNQDLCATAIACYSCGMFHMGRMDLQTNLSYLKVLQTKIGEAKRMGLDRQLEMYERMVETISKSMEDRDERKE